ncbi:GAF domain-containing protein [Frigoribacterium sp. VKM Ac-2530]|uniref:helix-turn-helix domain-containing protein n=1 Tax=Frigoribacterium sp. VKM Ac-2530 TaxID=2783822 RepID=UPI00188A71F6|nr:GAF domain-containing protein [Frigoribacterium sp. VKM Ac-2530]MBF4579570.1 GAF domain-containing protein [Frigoribacterium sp. VKM Ac-2530]
MAERDPQGTRGPQGPGWLQLLADQAGMPELEAHRRLLVADGADAARTDQEARSAVEVASLLQERRQRAVELAALNDIAGRLAAVADPADLLVEVVDQARRLLGVDLTYVALLVGDDLRIEVASGDRSSALVGTRLPRTAGLVGSVAAGGTPRWTSDYAADPELVHEESADRAARAESIRGLLGVPLAVRGRVLGVLLAAKREERRFGAHEISLLTGLAAHAAVAIDNARTAAELRDAKEGLESTLRLDADLTRAVLAGGDPASLVERVQALTDVPVRWVEHPAAGPVGAALAGAARSGEPGPVVVGAETVQPVAAAGQVFGALVAGPAGAGPAGAGSAGARPVGGAPADALLLLERAAPLIALTLVGARATARAAQLGRDIATVDLLSRGEPDAAADHRRWRGAGLDPRRPHVVVVVEGDPDAARRHVVGLGLGGHVASAVHRERFVLVAPASLELEERWGAQEAPVAGLAGPVVETAGLRAAWGEAARTARALTALGRRPGSGGGLSRGDDLGVFAVLLSRAGSRELHEQVERELGPVLAEEARRGVPLTETLEVFLDQGRRPTATAAALRVHVNTVYQRLATLDGLLGPAWRERALELQVLLRLGRAAQELDGPGAARSPGRPR